jgi:hypothetical protein
MGTLKEKLDQLKKRGYSQGLTQVHLWASKKYSIQAILATY